jgi:tetratricopeptide (TPR) repeat protein
MTTASLPAFREYVQGLDCVARPSELLGHIGYGTCGEHFERALAHDPGFALAHYQLAYLLASSGGSAAALKAHMDGALRSIDRLSRRDAELVRGWKAHLDGHDDEALAAYERVLAEHPDDKQVTYLAGDLLYHRGDYAGATPYFQAVLDLDRGAEWALDHLARCLAVTRRTKELTALADQLRAPPATAARRRVLLQVLTWLGRADEGVELARRAAEGGDDAARFDLAVALSAAGRVDEAEAVLAPLAEGKPEDVGLQMALMGYRVTLGRFRDVERMLLAPELGDKLEPYEHALYRALLAWARGDIRRLGEETMRGDRQQPGRLGALQVMVALHGDPELARRLAASLPADSTPAREVDALLAARSGHPVEASALLESLERTDPWPVNGVAPAYLLAEVAALAGDHEVVLAAVARFHRMFPMGFWRGHAFVRSLLLSARAHEALGRRDEARQDLSRVLALLRRADAELPLLREARALQARLAGGANR